KMNVGGHESDPCLHGRSSHSLSAQIAPGCAIFCDIWLRVAREKRDVRQGIAQRITAGHAVALDADQARMTHRPVGASAARSSPRAAGCRAMAEIGRAHV